MLVSPHDHHLASSSSSSLATPATRLAFNSSTISRSSSQTRLSHYYHPSFPFSSPEADLVLASADLPSCWFAIKSSIIFGSHPHQIGPRRPFKFIGTDRSRRVYSLQVSKEVVELILQCLVGNTLPDFRQIPFSLIVSALEMASYMDNVAHLEKICLLALGAYCRTKPIHVFVIASHYSCDWLARDASEYTLSYDLDDHEFRDILMVENYQTLTELQRFRVKSAHALVRALDFKPSHSPPGSSSTTTSSHSELSKLRAQHHSQASQLIYQAQEKLLNRITRPDVKMGSLLTSYLIKPSISSLKCEACTEELIDLCDEILNSWNHVRKTIL